MSSIAAESAGCLRTFAVFMLLMAPVYILLRMLVKLVRQAYGFDPIDETGQPLRVCGGCNNTVLEPEFEHCPYCGARLPEHMHRPGQKE